MSEGNEPKLTLKDALDRTDAPDWVYIVEARRVSGEKAIKRDVAEIGGRVSNLERAVVAGAAKSGAHAGRASGAFWGAMLAALISGLSTCDAPRAGDQHNTVQEGGIETR